MNPFLCTALSVCFIVVGCGQGGDHGREFTLDTATGTFGSGQIDYRKPTHIVVAGYTGDQEAQFVESALGRMHKYRELYPDHQVVLITHPEISGRTDDSVLRSFGLHVVEYNPFDALGASSLLTRMDRFTAIASFDFYGHSSPWAIGLSSMGDRLSTETSDRRLHGLRSKFTRDAYATLNGCNAGLYLAPHLSGLWQIPVAGALTGTNFQQLHNDGNWYGNDPGAYPAGGWAINNTRSYGSAKDCAEGACTRIKPDNVPYDGHWGTSKEGGLGFLKFFCKDQTPLSDCHRRMALSAIAYESVVALSGATLDDAAFEKVVLDHLCHNDKRGIYRVSCQAGIKRAVANGTFEFSSFHGNPLECSFDSCNFQYECERDRNGNPRSGTCALAAPQNDHPTTIAREYAAFMDGFAALKAQL